MEGTKPLIKSKSNNNLEGTPPLTGRALPNLINAVKMLKIKINVFISASAKTAERDGVVFVGANCVRPPLTLTS